MPFTLYIQSEDFINVDTLATLVADSTLLAVKYAFARANPPAKIVSGMGERRVLLRIREFGLAAWTTGSDCIAPHAVTTLMRAAKAGRMDESQALYDRFLPLEPVRPNLALHDGVTRFSIADTGANKRNTRSRLADRIERSAHAARL